MANLKGKLKTIGIFALGFLTGAILLGALLIWNYTVLFQNMYYAQILDSINTASMIRSGREDELVKRIETNIPQCVPLADSFWGDLRLGSLWSIQRYCEKYKLDVPAEIQPILKKLPPRPLTPCEMKKPQEQNSEPNMPEPNNPPAP